MRLLTFVAFLIYDFNKGPSNEVAYIGSLLQLAGIISLNIFGIMAMFDLADYFPHRSGSNLWNYYGRGALFVVPLFFLLRYFIPEEKLRKAEYDRDLISRGKNWLLVYLILSVAFITIAALLNS